MLCLVFEEQLTAWHCDIEGWPKPRTIAVFQTWFGAQVVDLVFELSEGPIEHGD